MKIDMLSSIKLMQKIGLNVDKQGVCQGIAMKAIEAFLLGKNEYQCYANRFETILQQSLGSKGIKPNKQNYLDIDAYLQGVAIYQNPKRYPALFSDKSISFLQVEEIAAVVQSNLTKERKGILKVLSFSGVYDSDDEIDKYLQSYQQVVVIAAGKEQSRCALLLHSYNHAIMLAYDVHSGWYLQSHDSRYELNKDINSVIREIRNAFSNDALILSTTIFSLGIEKCFANKVGSLWQNNADWKQLHDVTAEKATRHEGWLYLAAKHGYIEVVKELLEKGADINYAVEGFTPLYIALQNGQLEMVKELLKNGADVNRTAGKGFTALYIASENNYLEMVKELLEKGANCNLAATKGDTSLYIASQNGHIKVVQALLDEGADVNNSAGRGGFIPLYIASQNGQLEVVKELLKNGADVNLATSQGVTSLYIASQNARLEVVKELLKNGADINCVVGKKGFTPLFVASYMGHLEVVKELLEKGADVNLATSQGVTSLDIASQNNYLEIEKLLKNYQSKRENYPPELIFF